MPLPRRQPLTPRPVRRPPRAAYRIPGAPSHETADDAVEHDSTVDGGTAAPAAPATTSTPAPAANATPDAPDGQSTPATPQPDAAQRRAQHPVVQKRDPASGSDTPAAVALPVVSPSVPQTTAPGTYQETAGLDEPTFSNTVSVDAVPADGTAQVVQSIEAAAMRQRAQRAGVATATTATGAPPAVGGTRTARRVGQRVGPGVPGAVGAARGAGGPPRPPARVDTRPRWRRPRSWFLGIGGVVALVLLAVMVYAGYMGWTAWSAYNEAHVEPDEDRIVYTRNDEGTPVALQPDEAEAQLPDWGNDDPVNILLLGIDYRDGEDEPARSDTVMVVRVEPATGAVRMLSIPRDLLVDIPNHGSDKMNAAYPIGEVNAEETGSELGGPTLVAQTIESNFDIPIHYFMTVDFDGFRDIVDTVGGVVVDVRAQIKDDQYPTEDFGLTREYFPTGLQYMDGEKALRYARTRHGDNDVNRGQRQQQVLRAIREQATALGLITRADDLMRDLADTVRTDLNFTQMLALANIGRSLDTNAIETVDLWEMGVISEHTPEYEGDAFYFEADWSVVWGITAELFPRPGEQPTGSGLSTNRVTPTSESRNTAATATSDSVSSPDTGAGFGVDYDAPIAVRDFSSLGVAATQVAAELVADGFTLVVPEESTSVASVTTIYNYESESDTALHIAELLGLSGDAVIEASDGVGIVVLLGDDVANGYSP